MGVFEDDVDLSVTQGERQYAVKPTKHDGPVAKCFVGLEEQVDIPTAPTILCHGAEHAHPCVSP